MNWITFASATALTLAGISTADAGIFCRSCRSYSCSHAVKTVVQTQVVTKPVYVPQQTIVFNNAYPAAAPGFTSYQSYASVYSPTAGTFAALSSEALRIAGQNSAIGQGQAQVEAGLEALRLQTQQVLAVTQHLQAGLRGAAGGGSQTLILQIGADGTVRQVTPQQVGADGPAGQQPVSTGGVVAQRCAECHSGAQPKAEFYLDGQSAIDDRTAIAALRAIKDGKMPPSSRGALKPEEKAAIMEELLSLSSNQEGR